jgi:peptidoglycan hydrolase CwlO-like protein
MQRQNVCRRGALLLAAISAGLIPLVDAQPSAGDLGARQRALQQAINAENGQISAYRGRLSDLRARLSGIESSLAIQRALLVRIQSDLAIARHRLELLRADLARDRRVLAAQLVAQYESPPPDLVGVVMQSQGFADLLERVSQMRQLADQNAKVIKLVASIKSQVSTEAQRLTEEQARQQRVTAAVLIERDQVESLRLTMLEREQAVARDRAHKQSELRSVQHQLAVLQARAAAAQRAAFASTGIVSGGAPVIGSGEFGFFPAPGTNYSVGQEPILAARLNTLGKALHLHLIGLSGYRTPQHSVEVGGFADDPHTRGEASDTPGVEGVPEATLLRFGLTRPFGGAAEADHIQLA